MSTICGSCGRVVRTDLYRRHLYYEHGISRPESGQDLSKASGKKGRRARAAVITSALSHEPAPTSRTTRREAAGGDLGAHGARKIVTHTANLALAPTEAQSEILDAIFQAPEFCLYLFLTRWPLIASRADAEAFLYHHRHDIDPYLPDAYKRELIHALVDFMLEWSVEMPTHIGIDFECIVERNDTGTVAKIEGLGDVPVLLQPAKGVPLQLPLQVQATVALEGSKFRLRFPFEERIAVVRTLRVHQTPPLSESARSLFPAPTLRGDGIKKPTKASLALLERTQQANPDRPLPQPGRIPPGACPLCGTVVGNGDMLAHKRSAHGETMFEPSPCQQPRGGRLWVAVYQGGAPGLGKGKS